VSKGFKKAAWHESTSLELIMSEKAAADNNSMYMMKALLSQLEWPSKAQIEELATVLGLRVQLITGETDGLTPFSGALVLAEWLGPVADQRVAVENAGHMVMLEQPESVNALMSTFVNS
jgi:pimeloyl-ACP methyl ester carboxylesterase